MGSIKLGYNVFDIFRRELPLRPALTGAAGANKYSVELYEVNTGSTFAPADSLLAYYVEYVITDMQYRSTPVKVDIHNFEEVHSAVAALLDQVQADVAEAGV